MLFKLILNGSAFVVGIVIFLTFILSLWRIFS